MPSERSPILKVTNAEYAYKDSWALKGVSMEISPGEILVLLGPNGAGKSTLVKSVVGQIRLTSGEVLVNNQSPTDSAKVRSQSGFVPQDLAIYQKMTAIENLRAFGSIMGLEHEKVAARSCLLLEKLGLGDRKDQRVETLSGGMKRRVNIGVALMHEPKLIVLDEPTVGLDYKSKASLARLLQKLRDEGLAVLLTTHDMEEAELLSDRVAIMVDGRIVDQGKPTDVVKRAFGNKQQITIILRSDDRRDLDVNHMQTLQKMGFYPKGNKFVFDGYLDNNLDIAGAVGELATALPILKEIRVRKPGLDTLLKHFVDARSNR